MIERKYGLWDAGNEMWDMGNKKWGFIMLTSHFPHDISMQTIEFCPEKWEMGIKWGFSWLKCRPRVTHGNRQTRRKRTKDCSWLRRDKIKFRSICQTTGRHIGIVKTSRWLRFRMIHHPVLVVAAHKLLEVPELSQGEVFTVLMCHPVPLSKFLKGATVL